MEVESYIPDPDEFSHRNEDEQNRRLQFRLLRGYSVQEPADFVFPASSCRRRSIEQILGTMPRPMASSTSREEVIVATNENQDAEKVEDKDPDVPPVPQTRRATISAGTTSINPYRKRLSNLRDWPYGEPKVRNDEDFFELELRIGPFKPEEVSAKVMGKELIIHCKPDSNCRQAEEGVPEEIFRCYPLPLSAPPSPSAVSIVKDDHWIRVAVSKESALKSPIGIYSPEIAEVIEEEQLRDVEQESDESEVQMD